LNYNHIFYEFYDFILHTSINFYRIVFYFERDLLWTRSLEYYFRHNFTHYNYLFINTLMISILRFKGRRRRIDVTMVTCDTLTDNTDKPSTNDKTDLKLNCTCIFVWLCIRCALRIMLPNKLKWKLQLLLRTQNSETSPKNRGRTRTFEDRARIRL
jgi:hypothetical protein